MSEKEKYSVLIVDDHPLFRRGVRALLSLESSIEVAGEAGTREEALALAEATDPDLIILDLNMKNSSGVEILGLLKEKDISSRVVILTMSDSGDDLVACIRAGADGYFLKDMEPERFLDSVKQTLNGHLIVDPSMVAYLTSMLREQKKVGPQSHLPALTEREEEVLKFVAKGFTNKMVARELKISDGTVKGHVKHLLKKLGLKSRVEAAVWAANRQK